jgi:uncharacterized protein YdiU (UPF0061 family)
MEKPFIIFKVSWLTQQLGMEDKHEESRQIFYQTVKFLQENDLVVHKLISGIEDMTDDFILTSDDVTVEGMALMRGGYQKWLAKTDNGMSPEDVSILEKALKKIRGA